MVSSLNIGIAEDELDMREFYEVILPDLGHKLLWSARNGVELIEQAQKQRPDLLIADIQMPTLDGLDAVRALTRDEPLPVIVVSGHHDAETMKRAEARQLMCYLIKPIREADLKAAINIVAQRCGELRAYREAKARPSLRKALAKQNVLCAIQALAISADISQRQALHRIRERAKQEHRTLTQVSQTVLSDLEIAAWLTPP